MATTKPSAAESAGATAVEARLATMPEPHQTTLRALRATLRRVLPHAEEGIKYNMCSFIVNGEGVAAYDAFKEHCSYFPFSGNVLEAAGPLKGGTMATKGTLRFPVDAPLPVATVRTLVKVRLAQMSKPTKSGKRFDYFDDGTVKAAGSVKDGELHGRWTWYRKDGTLLRAGRFRMGVPTGVWETWDRDGQLVASTTY